MNVSLLALLQLIFIFYYVYTIYVMYKLHENSCQCKKLSKFNKYGIFYFIVIASSLLLILNIGIFTKCIQKGIKVPKDLCNTTILVITLGYGFAFLNDFLILKLFHIMDVNHCPCQTIHRNNVKYSTYLKIGVNIIYYLFSI
jgi:hypothetical protein